MGVILSALKKYDKFVFDHRILGTSDFQGILAKIPLVCLRFNNLCVRCDCLTAAPREPGGLISRALQKLLIIIIIIILRMNRIQLCWFHQHSRIHIYKRLTYHREGGGYLWEKKNGKTMSRSHFRVK